MILVWLAVGILIGLANALTMSVAVWRLSANASGRGLGWLMAGMLGRWTWTAALLAVAFWRGMAEGLLALTGFWAARWVAIVWWSRKG